MVSRHEAHCTIHRVLHSPALNPLGVVAGPVRHPSTEVLTMYQQHPLSAAFPAMGHDEFQALKESIVDLGVQNPVTLFEGMVLDGWHRYCAAIELGMECPERDLELWIDPRSYVLAQNKSRRHVTQAQLAIATTAVFAWRPLGSNQYAGSALSAEAPKSTKQLAEVAGVAVRSIEQAKVVQSKAAPEVVEAVRRGEIGLPKAAAIAKLPKQEQAAALHKPLPKPEQQEIPDDSGPTAEEIAAHEAAEAEDRELVAKLLDSNEPLAALVAENKQLKAEIAQLKMARDSYMNRCNEAIALVKARDRQIAKLEKMVGEAA